MSSKREPSVDELIATLKNTNLNTVIIEGKSDVVVYRNFPNRSSNLCFDVLPVGGRNNVLEIFKNKKEIIEKNRNKIKLVFVVDQDLWVTKGIPSCYQDSSIVTTDGYSIENDVIRDSSLINIVNHPHNSSFSSDLDKLIYWYALAVSRETDYKNHVNQVLSDYDRFIQINPNETYPIELKNKIENDFQKYLRGKSLLALLLNYKPRTTALNDEGILTLAGCNPGLLVQQIERKVHAALA